MTDLQKSLDALENKKSEQQLSLQTNQLTDELNTVKKILKQLEPIQDVTSELLNFFVKHIKVKEEGLPVITYRFSLFSELLALENNL
ncbi:hypothetical protein GCM10008935_14130 [Alkalibacillus silvisoli]|uniref:DUF4368 domain-containing protein n=2 Tax=Alkalibacillus silvisoli TaxID=392823 RepID=A0ABP3JP63_9BACI